MVLKIQNIFISYRPKYKNISEKLLKNGLKSNLEFKWKCLTFFPSKNRKLGKLKSLGCWAESNILHGLASGSILLLMCSDHIGIVRSRSSASLYM